MAAAAAVGGISRGCATAAATSAQRGRSGDAATARERAGRALPIQERAYSCGHADASPTALNNACSALDDAAPWTALVTLDADDKHPDSGQTANSVYRAGGVTDTRRSGTGRAGASEARRREGEKRIKVLWQLEWAQYVETVV